MENKYTEEILKIVSVGYRRGFLDGLNKQRIDTGEDEIREEEFETLGYSETIDEVVKKIYE